MDTKNRHFGYFTVLLNLPSICDAGYMKTKVIARNNKEVKVDIFTATAARLMSFAELQTRIGGLSRTTIWRMVRKGEFPAPRRVGGRALWSDADVTAWIEQTAQG